MFFIQKQKRIARRLQGLFYQIHGMLPALPWLQKVRFLALSLRFCREIVRTDRFLSVDAIVAKSLNHLSVRTESGTIEIPFRRMEEELNRQGNDGTSLELVRELFGNNEYLTPFRRGLKADIVLDIGSNRGFFVLVAGKILKAKKICCVEPQQHLQPVRHLLAVANGIPLETVVEYHKFCSSQLAVNTVSINQIMKEQKLQTVDFLKMDVEGAEADIFSNHLEWLDHCRNIAMEIHFSMAQVGFIPKLLQSKGFQVRLFDVRGRSVSLSESSFSSLPHGTAYLYASSENSLY